MKKETGTRMQRRHFLKTAVMTTAGLAIVPAAAVSGSEANSKIKLGLIGCGSRGAWIAKLFEEHAHFKVVAVHDYFRDRVTKAGQALNVDPSRQYVGLDGYKELLAGDVDAVAVESPPYFHPEQAVAALKAGKHVYLAKPIAVDVPGCTAIVDAAREAEGKLSVLVDFQTRNNEFFRGAAQRVHEGMIGQPVCGQFFYYAGRLAIKAPRPRLRNWIRNEYPLGNIKVVKDTYVFDGATSALTAPPGSEVFRLRNWVFDKALSGDIIVEQNIHVLDVANWYLQAHPIKAHGAGGRKARIDVGDCWDHFVVGYTYPNGVLVDFSSGQFTYGFDDLCMRLFGSLGTVESHYGGDVYIRGKKDGWKGGKTPDIYREGAVNNIKDFYASIESGQYLNNAQESAHSTMTSILGRIAAYENREATWEEMVKANVRLDPKLDLPADGPERKS